MKYQFKFLFMINEISWPLLQALATKLAPDLIIQNTEQASNQITVTLNRELTPTELLTLPTIVATNIIQITAA